jgi:hypothetical protein
MIPSFFHSHYQSQRIKLASKIIDEWSHVKDLPKAVTAQAAKVAQQKAAAATSGQPIPSPLPSASESKLSAGMSRRNRTFVAHTYMSTAVQVEFTNSSVSTIIDDLSSKKPYVFSLQFQIRLQTNCSQLKSKANILSPYIIQQATRANRDDWKLTHSFGSHQRSSEGTETGVACTMEVDEGQF